MGLIFEWDERKARQNSSKHGVSFEEATTVFEDPLSLTIEDPVHSDYEGRFVTIGQSVQGRMLVIVYTDRIDKIRIISSRAATPHERKSYEEKKSRS